MRQVQLRIGKSYVNESLTTYGTRKNKCNNHSMGSVIPRLTHLQRMTFLGEYLQHGGETLPSA